MGRNFSFLFLASIVLSTNSNAMEDVPPAFNQIRQRYNLPTADSYGIPQRIQTGHFAELYQPEQIQLTLDPHSPTFYEELKREVLTPAKIYELLPLDKQAEFFSTIREEGSKIDFLPPDIEIRNEVLRKQANLAYAKFLLISLNQATLVIPAALFKSCPATLIVDQQFSPDDDDLSLASKYEKLGLAIKDIEEGLTLRDRADVMSESFSKAGEHFLKAARKSEDAFSVPDLLISSGICYEWSAIHTWHYEQAKEKLGLAQNCIRDGYKSLNNAYREYRTVMAAGRNMQVELAEIKAQLSSYAARIVTWSKKFDPSFFAQLARTYEA